MKDLTYKRIRSLLVGMCFIAIGVSLYQNPQIGVAKYITEYYPIVPFCGAFILFGIIEAWRGWEGKDVNMVWYSPFYAYTAATYLAVANGEIPPVAAIVYILLASLFTVDAIRDF